MISSIIQALFHSAQYERTRKEATKIYDLLNTKTKPKKISKITGASLLPPSSPDCKLLDYAIGDISENKTNVTSHPNIGSLKIAIEEEWIKMSEEFILKACKLFQRRIDTITEKIAATMSTFTVLYLFFIL